MSFADEIARMHAVAADTFGGAATFRPATGAPVSGLKVERREPQREFGLEHAKGVVADALLIVSVASLPRAPMKGDVFEIANLDWRVLSKATIEDDDGALYTIQVERARAV